jgi:hypothetical protein
MQLSINIECPCCKGTGLYQGSQESDGIAVVCLCLEIVEPNSETKSFRSSISFCKLKIFYETSQNIFHLSRRFFFSKYYLDLRFLTSRI